MTKIQENANPAAVGFRFTAESGTEWELVWTRSPDVWLMGINAGHGWITSTAPGIERAHTLKDARRIVAEFVNLSDD